MTQVHKESLGAIENALPNRSGLEVEIFGMEGIPEDVVTAHQQRMIGQFAQAEAERRAATGNPGPGGAGGAAAKKPKFESPSDLKKRLAEHKAKIAAEQAAGISSGDATPSGAGYGGQSPPPGQSPNNFAGPPGYQQPPYGAPPQNGAPFQQPYNHQPGPFPPQQPPPNYPAQQPQFPQQPPGFGSPGMHPQYPNNQPYAPQQPFQQPVASSFAQPFHNGPPPQPFNPGSPPPFQQSQFQPPSTHPLPQNGMLTRAPNLPPAPGLPQRPSFGAPPANAIQMQQMHQGQIPGSPPVPQPITNNATSLDDLVSGAAKDADNFEASAKAKADGHTGEKKVRKEKDKNIKLVYSDNDVSPEEKMAQLPRYAFTPKGEKEGMAAETTTSSI